MESENIIIGRREYDSLVMRLRHLEKELKLINKDETENNKKHRYFWQRVMQRLAIVFVVAILIMGIVVVGLESAENSERFGGVTGNNWQRWGEIPRISYTAGFDDGFIIGIVQQRIRPKTVDNYLECTNYMTGGQQLAIIDKYLKDNPHKWDKYLRDIIWDAFTEACMKRGYKLR